jgi:hypothetical protein
MRTTFARPRAAFSMPRFAHAKTRLQRPKWRSLSRAIPSWFLSLLLHSAALCLIAMSLPWWQQRPVGFGDTDGNLGVIDGSLTAIAFGFDSGGGGTPGDASTADEASSAETVPPEVQTTAVAPLTAVPSLPSRVAVSDFASATNVSGAALPMSASSNPRDLIHGRGGSGGGSGGGHGGGHGSGTGAGSGIAGTAFMGVRDKATRVVFVIDSSASMLNWGAMSSAKAALISALQTLVDAQQFQVVFYNDTPKLLRLRSQQEPALAFATEVNKSLARQEIGAVSPDLGTNHIDALKLALRLGPEVIYLLTDADQPELSAAELDQIQRTNKGRARIHTIEFGRGPELDNGALNFLQKLARQNGGTYRYYNVKQLDRQ